MEEVIVLAVYIFIPILLFWMFMKAVGGDKLLLAWMSRSKPIEEKNIDYDAALVKDAVRSAGRARGPAKYLYAHDPNDWEHPGVYWGRIRGITPHTDVARILVRRRMRIRHELVFVPKSRLSDLHSRVLYAHCEAFELINRRYWIPVYGSTVNTEAREYLNEIVWRHINTMWFSLRAFIAHESGTTQMVKSMESTSGRAPVEREPQMVQPAPVRGEEMVE